MTKKILSSIIGLFFCLLIISCENSIEKRILGIWKNNGRLVRQTDKILEEEFASDYSVTYEFKSDNTLRSELNEKSNWKIDSDSILVITSEKLKQVYSIELISDSLLVLIELKGNTEYIYKFEKIKE